MFKGPTFFIIGAPKCGTTAMADYLSEHPNVFLSTPKEPHYFASDMVIHRAIETAQDYFELFEGVNNKHIAIGEASVWYLYSKKAIKNIYIYNKNAKLIVMLRKPLDMVFSLHSQQCYNLQEDIKEFEKAWDFETERKHGRFIPKNIYHIPNLFYSEVAMYHKQLTNVFNFFPKKQVKIILFDDFIQNTAQTYQDILVFLELPNYQKDSFPIVNQNKRFRYEQLQKLTILIHHKRKLINSLKKALCLKKIGLSKIVKHINTYENKRTHLHPLVKARVVTHYKDEVQKLSQLINRDLSHWNAT